MKYPPEAVSMREQFDVVHVLPNDTYMSLADWFHSMIRERLPFAASTSVSDVVTFADVTVDDASPLSYGAGDAGISYPATGSWVR